MKRDYYLFILPALSIILLDQLSKFIVSRVIGYHESITLIDGFFDLVHIRNRGMAFGLMNRQGTDFSYYFLVTATLIAIVLLILWFSRIRNGHGLLIFGLSFILGGALGNLIDRLRHREVIDFLDFYLGKYHWPAFNLADSAITLGTALVIISIFLSGPYHDRKEK